MSQLDDVLKTIRDGIVQIAREKAAEYLKQIESDGSDFLNALKEDLTEWSKQLANGELPLKKFEILVRGRKSLAEMTALTEIGLAKVKIDQIRTAIINLVIDAVWGAFKKAG